MSRQLNTPRGPAAASASAGLTAAQKQALRRAEQQLAAGDLLMAGQTLLGLASSAGAHPEVLRLQARRHATLGEWAAAAQRWQALLTEQPQNVPAWTQLALTQERLGDSAAARHSLQTALQAPEADAAAWLALSQEADRQGAYEAALAAVNHALQQQTDLPMGLLQRSRCTKALGDAAASAADCRRLIALGRETARAWFSLVDLKTVPLLDGELQALQTAAAQAQRPRAEQLLLDFALGKALEDAGQAAAALASLRRANQAARATKPWDGAAFARQVEAVRLAFLAPPDGPPQGQGQEVIFLVGLPRSGTTLVEQVLAAHSAVEGASELPYLGEVIEAESRRRGRSFPTWVPQASAEDWQRLGRDYLQRSAHWRASKPRHTDKLPDNWLLAGAVRAMLPGARVIDCRRDPVETCWSCYKQLFGPGHVLQSYDLADLATHWQHYDRLCRHWAARDPLAFRAQSYERLVAEPDTQIRELLAFCGLPFEAACLSPHTAQRAIRTPSALQVRRPMRTTSTPAAAYGDLLDELRQRLLPLAD